MDDFMLLIFLLIIIWLIVSFGFLLLSQLISVIKWLKRVSQKKKEIHVHIEEVNFHVPVSGQIDQTAIDGVVHSVCDQIAQNHNYNPPRL